jgi:hypothetical protein
VSTGAGHRPAGGDASPGRRRGQHASGTPGYDASADYVAGRLRAAGYTVTEQEFVFPFYRELSPAVLEQVSPTPTPYVTGTFDFSGTGDVTGVVVPTTTS